MRWFLMQLCMIMKGYADRNTNTTSHSMGSDYGH